MAPNMAPMLSVSPPAASTAAMPRSRSPRQPARATSTALTLSSECADVPADGELRFQAAPARVRGVIPVQREPGAVRTLFDPARQDLTIGDRSGRRAECPPHEQRDQSRAGFSGMAPVGGRGVQGHVLEQLLFIQIAAMRDGERCDADGCAVSRAEGGAVTSST